MEVSKKMTEEAGKVKKLGNIFSAGHARRVLGWTIQDIINELHKQNIKFKVEPGIIADYSVFFIGWED